MQKRDVDWVEDAGYEVAEGHVEAKDDGEEIIRVEGYELATAVEELHHLLFLVSRVESKFLDEEEG